MNIMTLHIANIKEESSKKAAAGLLDHSTRGQVVFVNLYLQHATLLPRAKDEPLYAACRGLANTYDKIYDFTEVATSLINAGADPNFTVIDPSERKFTPLYWVKEALIGLLHKPKETAAVNTLKDLLVSKGAIEYKETHKGIFD